MAMNTADLLQPDLLETDVLKEHLKQRCLFIPNIDELPRSELLKIFYNYAVPRHKRMNNAKANTKLSSPPNAASSSSSQTSGQNGSKRPRHERILYTSNEMFSSCPNSSKNNKSPLHMSVDDVTNECKKIKLINSDANGLKRKMEQMAIEVSPQKQKRTKITWP